eukprot:282285-Pyramimonas_sp.AAC.1
MSPYSRDPNPTQSGQEFVQGAMNRTVDEVEGVSGHDSTRACTCLGLSYVRACVSFQMPPVWAS